MSSVIGEPTTVRKSTSSAETLDGTVVGFEIKAGREVGHQVAPRSPVP